MGREIFIDYYSAHLFKDFKLNQIIFIKRHLGSKRSYLALAGDVKIMGYYCRYQSDKKL